MDFFTFAKVSTYAVCDEAAESAKEAGVRVPHSTNLACIAKWRALARFVDSGGRPNDLDGRARDVSD